METDDRVGEVGIESHTRGQGNGKIGKQTHAERSESSNSGCCCHQIPLDLLDALEVLQGAVGNAGVLARSGTDTVTTAIGDDARLESLMLFILKTVMELSYS